MKAPIYTLQRWLRAMDEVWARRVLEKLDPYDPKYTYFWLVTVGIEPSKFLSRYAYFTGSRELAARFNLPETLVTVREMLPPQELEKLEE